jgi:hypothetical protein
MDKKYWLRFGLILLIAYIVIGAISYVLIIECSAHTSGLDGFGCLKYSIPLIIATAPFFERINDFFPNGIIFLLNAAVWFLVGSIIGWIYGKLKRWKETKVINQH